MSSFLQKGGNSMSIRKALIFWVTVLIMGLISVPLPISAAMRTIQIALADEPTTIDPTASGTAPDFQATDNYVEYLVLRAPSGDLKPGLATSWTVSKDAKIIEFILRKDVRFHSGDRFTARDVLFSYEIEGKKSRAAKSRLEFVDRLEIIDDYKIKVHFKAPDVTFIPSGAGMSIVSKAYFDRVGEEQFVKNPVGTGPYKLS
jgi:peptide/nickel transport system substrate-binding protein